VDPAVSRELRNAVSLRPLATLGNGDNVLEVPIGDGLTTSARYPQDQVVVFTERYGAYGVRNDQQVTAHEEIRTRTGEGRVRSRNSIDSLWKIGLSISMMV